jgi:hypothetical protein
MHLLDAVHVDCFVSNTCIGCPYDQLQLKLRAWSPWCRYHFSYNVSTGYAAPCVFQCNVRAATWLHLLVVTWPCLLDAGDALEWACVLQLALMYVQWPAEVVDSPAMASVFGPDGALLHRGVRARVGVYRGTMSRIIPHR